MSGGDWTDASVEHIVLNADIDLREKKAIWDKWYKDEYCPVYDTDKRIEFYTFTEWLLHSGIARKTTKFEVEEFWEI